MNIPDRIRRARYLLIDSRKLLAPTDTVFFAIRGTYLDGRQFIPELYHKGVRLFVGNGVSTLSERFSDACFWEVSDPIAALQALAAEHRAQFSYPVLGITGSNAKTIIKEWLFQLLEGEMKLVKSPKSYNSQIGTPLSVWEMDSTHELGIFEAGISQAGEMQQLAQILQPTIGLFTNIGPAHQEGFHSLEEKIEQKLQLFSHSQRVIYCYDHEAIRQQVQERQLPAFTWGRQAGADLRLIQRHAQKGSTEVVLQAQPHNPLGMPAQKHTYQLPFTDSASIENALHCIAVCLLLGVKDKTLTPRLWQLKNLPMRLALKEGMHQSIIIDDTYNNDFSGLSAALAFLNQQDAQLPRVAILSDFLETEGSLQKYQEVIDLLQAQKIQQLFAIGKQWCAHRPQLTAHLQLKSFGRTEQLLEFLPRIQLQRAAFLVKGARPYTLERVVEALQQKAHETRLEINLDALAHNFRFYKSLLPAQVKIMAMVKAFAYGSGGYEVASLLQYHRADYLAVAYTDEGVALRQRGIYLPIMVLNPAEEAFPLMASYNLEPEIYSLRLFKAFVEAMSGRKNVPSIHIKLNTGMNRLGFDAAQLPELLRYLTAYPAIKVASAFTHLAAADDRQHEAFTQQQLSQYEAMAKQLSSVIRHPYLKHALNSPGITRFPEASYDMVRLGIGLYGVDTNNFYQENLQTVGTLKTYISQIREIKKGETVGYSRAGIAHRDSRIGVIAIGYADGYDRRLSNGVGSVYINGRYAPVIGNVCMDMSMIDLTGIDAEEGDEVIIFGADRPIQEVAASIQTIPYEILTNVGQRVKRIFFTS